MSQDSEKTLRQTYEHIHLVQKLLASAQIQLMRRQFTHDRSKLSSPEWEMFAEITHKLEGLTYGSPEYEAQRNEMLGLALGHHYEHNRHHPEYFPQHEDARQVEGIKAHRVMAKWAMDNAQVLPDDCYGYRNLDEFLARKEAEAVSPVNEMNLFDLLEMIVDWVAATKRHADGDIQKSIEINAGRFSLSPQLVSILTNTVEAIADSFDGLSTQKDL
jgi:hypothetical protein